MPLFCVFKNRHISRINISDKYKIVINSAEVHAEIGHKNLIIVSYKNHLERLCRTEKQFLYKDLQYNFVQFLVQEIGMA
jgi:hypothetical protein